MKYTMRNELGVSAVVDRDTYSSYSRGVDAILGVYQWLDRAPKGRNETGDWRRRHDEYDSE